MKFLTTAAAFLASASLVAGQTIVDIAVDSSPEFETLVLGVTLVPGLADTLSGPGPFTLFAPTDDAFPPALVNYLAQPENVDTLSAVLQYHVVADKVLSGALMNGQIVDSLTGSTLTISIMGDTIMVNDATVITPNVEGTNGVIHIIDKVLVPPDGSISLPNLVDTAVANSDLSTLVDAVVAADLATALSSPGPFTVFAPTDDGFGMIPAADLAGLITAEDKTPLRNILLYHVVQELITGQDILDGLLSATTMQGAELTFSVMDGVPMVNGTPVLGTAVATNGIAHVIGEVLTAPSIVELAAGSPDFSTLVAAVTAAGLAPVLSAPGPFTVFAPTNPAFPAALVYYLTRPANVQTLVSILQYHVVSGSVLSSALMDEQTFPSLLPGSDLTISIEGDTIMVNDATVTNPNIVGSNGVIHGIDKILVPPDGVISLPNLVDVASGIPASFETLVAAVVAADLATALSGPGPFTLFAPNEVGFGALPEGTVKDLVGAEDKTPLSDILLYHVVQELITGQDILDGLLSAKTMQGADLTFSVMDGVPMVNGTPVLSTAVATNGIAHVIGEVLFAPTAAPVSGAPTMAPMDEDDGALSTSTVVAALVSAAALLMV